MKFFLIITILSFLLGVSVDKIFKLNPCVHYQTPSEHWSEFRKSVEGVYKLSRKDKLAGLKHPSFKLDYHLNRLQDENKIKFKQYVFPEFNRDLYIPDMLEKDKLKEAGIVWAVISYELKSISDELPEDLTCINVWYKTTSEESVDQYIHDLHYHIKERIQSSSGK